MSLVEIILALFKSNRLSCLNIFLFLVQCNKKQSAMRTLIDMRPRPAPIVNNNGTILNLPPVPNEFIIILRPYALNKIRYSLLSYLYLFA